MRLTAIPAALLLVLGIAAPAFADGSLPLIAVVQAGPYRVSIHNDSKHLRSGTNRITLEVDGKPTAHSVSVTLVSPDGQTMKVPMRNLIVLGSASADDHSHGASPNSPGSSSDHSSMGSMPGMDMSHPMPGTVPSAPAAAPSGEAAPHEHGNGTFLARGEARLSMTGTWTARLEVWDEHGEPTRTEVSVPVVPGSPNPYYMGFTGTLIGGSLLYGTINRRRQTGPAGGTRRSGA